MNISVSIWPSVAAILYFLGVYLHWLHIQTIFHLLDRWEDMSVTKGIINSILWPITLVFSIITVTFLGDSDDA